MTEDFEDQFPHLTTEPATTTLVSQAHNMNLDHDQLGTKIWISYFQVACCKENTDHRTMNN